MDVPVQDATPRGLTNTAPQESLASQPRTGSKRQAPEDFDSIEAVSGVHIKQVETAIKRLKFDERDLDFLEIESPYDRWLVATLNQIFPWERVRDVFVLLTETYHSNYQATYYHLLSQQKYHLSPHDGKASNDLELSVTGPISYPEIPQNITETPKFPGISTGIDLTEPHSQVPMNGFDLNDSLVSTEPNGTTGIEQADIPSASQLGWMGSHAFDPQQHAEVASAQPWDISAGLVNIANSLNYQGFPVVQTQNQETTTSNLQPDPL